jgi:hypothetical protein
LGSVGIDGSGFRRAFETPGTQTQDGPFDQPSRRLATGGNVEIQTKQNANRAARTGKTRRASRARMPTVSGVRLRS